MGSLENILYWCMVHISCEHLHDLYTLNSLLGWKGLNKFIPRDSLNPTLIYILFSLPLMLENLLIDWLTENVKMSVFSSEMRTQKLQKGIKMHCWHSPILNIYTDFIFFHIIILYWFILYTGFIFSHIIVLY